MYMDTNGELVLNVKIAAKLDNEIAAMKKLTGQPKKTLVAWACFELAKRAPELQLKDIGRLMVEYDTWVASGEPLVSKTVGMDAARPTQDALSPKPSPPSRKKKDRTTKPVEQV